MLIHCAWQLYIVAERSMVRHPCLAAFVSVRLRRVNPGDCHGCLHSLVRGNLSGKDGDVRMGGNDDHGNVMITTINSPMMVRAPTTISAEVSLVGRSRIRLNDTIRMIQRPIHAAISWNPS